MERRFGHHAWMSSEPFVSPQAFFAGHPLGLAALSRVQEIIGTFGGVEVRVTRSQVAFRCRSGFAYLWLPGRYLARSEADVVLSVALHHRIESPRWKQVVEPAPDRWMHHLELHALTDIDHEVRDWLQDAACDAGCRCNGRSTANGHQ